MRPPWDLASGRETGVDVSPYAPGAKDIPFIFCGVCLGVSNGFVGATSGRSRAILPGSPVGTAQIIGRPAREQAYGRPRSPLQLRAAETAYAPFLIPNLPASAPAPWRGRRLCVRRRSACSDALRHARRDEAGDVAAERPISFTRREEMNCCGSEAIRNTVSIADSGGRSFPPSGTRIRNRRRLEARG